MRRSVFFGLLVVAALGIFIMTEYVEEKCDWTAGVNRSKHESAEVMNRMTIKEHIEMYRKFFFEKGDKVPSEPLPQQRVDLPAVIEADHQGVKSAWLGHSSLLINIDGNTLLTDPVFERKVTLVGPTRFNKELPLKVDDIEHVDAVVISHDHYDHLNKFSIKRLASKTGVFIVPARVGERLRKWGVADEKIVELNWWEEYAVNSRLTIAATPSQHFSGRGLFDKNRTLWASWVIRTEEHRVFFSGDSGYFKGFKEIGDKYGPFDVAYMECGAYDRRWSNIHMLPEQTVQAFRDLGGKVLQPIHWATFNLALHAWYEPIERVTAAAWSSNIKIVTPMIGELTDFNEPVVAELWWVVLMKKSFQPEQPQPAVVTVQSINE